MMRTGWDGLRDLVGHLAAVAVVAGGVAGVMAGRPEEPPPPSRHEHEQVCRTCRSPYRFGTRRDAPRRAVGGRPDRLAPVAPGRDGGPSGPAPSGHRGR